MTSIPYSRQHITDEDKQAVLSVLDSPLLTSGPYVENFEASIKQFVQAPYASAVINGTAALHIAAMALNVKPGDKVLVAANTFVASANCIRYCGGDVEFLDVDPQTFCLDLVQLEAKLKAAKPKTYKGIVAVDFAGYAVDMEALRKIADQYGLWIIEDSCHAIGAEFKNSRGEWTFCGNGEYADLSVFSFHPVKHIATGEGGMITTKDKTLWEKVNLLRSHGIVRDSSEFTRNDGPWYYEMQHLGYNYRIPDILCALGISQMSRLRENLKRRRELANVYYKELEGLPITLPFVPSSVRHAYHLFVIQTSQRLELYQYLKTQGIHCQVHYIPVHKQPYYEKLYGKTSLPAVEKYYSQALSIPMFHALSDEHQATVIQKIKAFFKS